ncbi:hypothetical protein BZG36_05035 [Bifiguratus adelaidae]|uniref:Methyltransferase type 11 domain-containing protein n=1 Tax=Bifiguratus adelaidae TaxID=1938954 RepID=A0A261XV72_9FUNG|nr:hypothetical protein BZG36_05035 [Bifiguratus adelaidae]
MSNKRERKEAFERAQDKFMQILTTLDKDEREYFKEFVGGVFDQVDGQWASDLSDHDSDGQWPDMVEVMKQEARRKRQRPTNLPEQAHRLNEIIADLRETLPVTAQAPDETITIPETEDFHDYTEQNTVHVDAFLYDDDAIDDLCDQGKMSRNYCLKCGSHDTKPLNFISHSASVPQLQYIFRKALRKAVSKTLKEKVILDIGSRTGAVLYSGYLFSDAKTLIGVELSPFFCDLQEKMIIRDDILKVPEVIAQADIIIMNNVFQFFADVQKQREIWNYLKTETSKKPGAIIITIPALEEQLSAAGLPSDMTKRWLFPVQMPTPSEDDEDLEHIHMYRVI